MRILVINTNTFGRDGITSVVKNLFYNMDRSGVSIDFVTINEPDEQFLNDIKSAGGRLFVVKRRTKNLVKYFLKLKEIIKNGRYDLVHVHGNSATLVIEMLAAKMAGCPIRIAHSHNTTCNNKLIHLLFGPLFRSLCTHALACGKEAGEWLFKRKKQVTVVNNGVSVEKFRFNIEKRNKIRYTHGISSNTKVIGHVGMFSTQKNHCFLIDSFAAYLKRKDDAKLMLIGYGALDKVIFTGPTDDVSDYLSAMDCFVLPSLYEGLPVSLVEAQVSGLECFASNKVTEESNKTGNVKYLSIESVDQWSEVFSTVKILSDEERTQRSKLCIEKIKECGYSIVDEATKLKKYYDEALMKGKNS